ncbi:NAD(P)H-binding protein [Actinocorallia longicatena]|uniref:NAD(P)H-binding protein n=1 Tax=Actinocorallia longicatena TaxID=111803 RepID=A0ABP6Q7G8_9ACTN
MKIAIIGGTGTIGAHLLPLLAKTDAQVTALARTSAAAEAVRRSGATPILGDLSDGEAVKSLVGEADSLLLLTANTPGQLDQESRVIEANASSRRALVVKVSAPGVSGDSPLAFGRTHHAAEELLRASGVDHVVIRPGWLMQNVGLVLDGIVRGGELALPIGTGAIAAVDARDVAAACRVALTEPARLPSGDLLVIGREDVDGAAMAEALSTAARRAITFRDATREEFEASLRANGTHAELVDDLAFLYDVVIRNGFVAGPDSSVEELTGARATTFGSFATDHSAWFTPRG